MMATSSLVRIAIILAIGVVPLITYSFGTDNVLSLPKDFLLGAALSSYQIEGAWNEDGKGLNIWDRYTHEHPEAIFDHSTGDVACDFYHKYKEDVQIMKNIGIDFYRFSLSWSRILPTGYPNVINYKGLKFYKDLIDELIANGIEPFITLYHWDHPDVFEKMGGWTNELMIDWISDFARVVFRELGPKVKYFTTINEALIFCEEGYMLDKLAPAKNLGPIGKYLCLHNTLKAHARIYHIYDEEFRKEQNGIIGVVEPCLGLFPKTPNDTAAVDTFFQFECGLMSNPIFSKTGDYSQIVKDHIAENSKLEGYPRSILPKFSPEWVKYIKNSADFIGLNHYTSRLVETVPRTAGQAWYEFSGVKLSIDPSWPSTGTDWLKVVPSGLRQVLNQFTTKFDHLPIYILENGMSDNDCNVNDTERIKYLHDYMSEMLSALHIDGCNIKGYAVWSLIDNFEWARGYTERFGLVCVDFMDPNRTRTPKASMQWYKNVIRTRELRRRLTLTEFNPAITYV